MRTIKDSLCRILISYISNISVVLGVSYTSAAVSVILFVKLVSNSLALVIQYLSTSYIMIIVCI